MKKIKLKILEFYQLYNELNGVIDQEKNSKLILGLLNDVITPLNIKYWLNELNNEVIDILRITEKNKTELLLNYGTVSEVGEYFIEYSNPLFREYFNIYNEIINEEKEIEYFSFSLSDFSKIKSSSNYPILFRLIKHV